VRSVPPEAPFDLVLVDPPYDLPDAALRVLLERLDEAGWLTEGATIVDYYPPITDPAWKPFVTAWEKYATPDQQKSDDISLLGAETTWIGYNIAKQVGEEIEGEITSSSFLEALQKASKVETGGVTPPIDFTKPFPSPELSALYNTSVTFEEVKNGEITWPDEEFHDMGPAYLKAQQ